MRGGGRGGGQTKACLQKGSERPEAGCLGECNSKCLQYLQLSSKHPGANSYNP